MPAVVIEIVAVYTSDNEATRFTTPLSWRAALARASYWSLFVRHSYKLCKNSVINSLRHAYGHRDIVKSANIIFIMVITRGSCFHPTMGVSWGARRVLRHVQVMVTNWKTGYDFFLTTPLRRQKMLPKSLVRRSYRSLWPGFYRVELQLELNNSTVIPMVKVSMPQWFIDLLSRTSSGACTQPYQCLHPYDARTIAFRW